MPSIDTNKLLSILTAAQNPAFKKLLDEKAKAEKGLEDAKTQLVEIETRLSEAIPPALKSLLHPEVALKPKKEKPSSGHLKKLDLQELKQILDRRPDRTLNIRQDGFDSKIVKSIALAHPDLFVYEKGTWPKVRYVK